MAENFEIYGLEEFIKDLNKMDSSIKEELQKLVEKYGGKILRDVKMKTPVGQYNDGRTGGQLRKGWNLEKGDLYVRIYNNTEYAIYVEYGHRTRQGKGHSNPAKHYKYKPKEGGIRYVEGVYMLKTTFEKQVKNFESDLEKLLGKYGFK